MGIKESRFNSLFRRELAKLGFKFDRVESHGTAPGLPDNAFVHDFTRLSGWIEVKEEMTMPRRVKYRPKQALWQRKHVEIGGNAMTVVHLKTDKQVVIIPGKHAVTAEKDLHCLVWGGQALLLNLSHGWKDIANAIIDQCEHTRSLK